MLQCCAVCPLARQVRLPFPNSHSKSSKCFDLVHMDVWGPYKSATHNRMKFFLTLVDDYSRWTWIYLMHLKSDVSTMLKQFLAMVQTQHNAQVKCFRSDNGGEFFNAQVHELFTSQGIIHQSSCPHTPQQNGVVERKHRHIMETTRAIKFQGHIPIKFWGECVLAAVHINYQQDSIYCID